MSLLTSTALTYSIIALAEIGDKSQLVCMTLASRHKPWLVLLGSSLAFIILNSMAVLFGSAITLWIPIDILKAMASAIFIAFGIHAFVSNENDEDDDDPSLNSKHILITTFLMIFLAELGDKTQLAVATLSLSESALGVWIGSSLALITTSAVAVYFGSTLLHRINPLVLKWVTGGLFMVIGVLIGWQAVSNLI